MQKSIVIGTTNQKKKEEIRKILAGIPVKLLDLENFKNPPDVVEDGATFKENAVKKARELAGFCNMWVMADDSGLEVDALDRRPGVLSSRYCGKDTGYEEKCYRLLEEMKGVAFERRTARFRCSIALADPEELLLVVEAECEGLIASAPRGIQGFGYDPIFFVPEYRQTFAELKPEVKNRVSHRALALRLFSEKLMELAG
ncbi:MAG: XTP/dITP diphosphatase [Candidatus Scalindua sp.]|nr:XTP/dITP diphosphatase [Candidatus Scalindua sp.]